VGKFVQQDRREDYCDEKHCQSEAAEAQRVPERPGQNGGGDEEGRVQIDRHLLILRDLHGAVLHRKANGHDVNPLSEAASGESMCGCGTPQSYQARADTTKSTMTSL
jgi:hypothetical protein